MCLNQGDLLNLYCQIRKNKKNGYYYDENHDYHHQDDGCPCHFSFRFVFFVLFRGLGKNEHKYISFVICRIPSLSLSIGKQSLIFFIWTKTHFEIIMIIHSHSLTVVFSNLSIFESFFSTFIISIVHIKMCHSSKVSILGPKYQPICFFLFIHSLIHS